jgi:hypothetical protein
MSGAESLARMLFGISLIARASLRLTLVGIDQKRELKGMIARQLAQPIKLAVEVLRKRLDAYPAARYE